MNDADAILRTIQLVRSMRLFEMRGLKLKPVR
jgi:hypothetical protein